MPSPTELTKTGLGLADWASRLAQSPEAGDFAWLDGGQSGSFLGVRASQRIAGHSLSLLEDVDRAWRAYPDQVWIGWISYDCCAEDLLGRPMARQEGAVQLEFRRYSAVLHERTDGTLSCLGPEARDLEKQLIRQLESRAQSAGMDAVWPFVPPRACWQPEHYRRQVEAVQRYLRAGDSYQVNLSQRFHADWRASLPKLPDSEVDDAIAAATLGGYLNLRERAPANMGALIRAHHDAWIISNSPETLVEVESATGQLARQGIDTARCRPIKGTTPRLAQQNDLACEALFASVKDRAEHLMIVDLIRNDLGRMALAGSVRAPREPSLLKLPTVNHLVSTVECQLAAQWSLLDLFRAVAPGGSITGAPKRRTIEIIEELEAEPRGIYCGAICILHPQGLKASIPIRTGWVDRRGLSLRSGGGIVMDSDAERERLETLTKLRAFAPGV